MERSLQELFLINRRMKKDKVYIVTEDFCIDCNTEDLIIRAFANKDNAIKYLRERVANYEQIVHEREWFTELDEDWIFRANDDYHYHENHIEILMTECEVE